MRRAIPMVASLALLFGSCASSFETTGAGDALAPSIEALNRRLEERFREGDMLGVANVYADDALLVSSDSRVEGRSAVDAYWSEVVDPVRWRIETFEIGGSPELAYQRGRSHLTRRRDGLEHTSVVHFMRIWKKDAGDDWKIRIEASW